MENDVFHITKHMKSIQKTYFVCYNLTTKKYEVHNSAHKTNTFCYSIPFKQLDRRAITHMLKQSKKSNQQLFHEVEENNQKIQKNAQQNLSDEAHWKLKEIVTYASSGGKDYSHNNSFVTPWV